MAKKKQFLHPKKESGKRKPAGPETANEYLEAGVDHEEAGEKWRAGDAAKSLRFFMRAIDTYEEGLHRFPEAFDLAYNKARLQFEVAQQPRLLAHLPTPLNELLHVALDSHRYAVKLDQDNADLLFNTAQVLTSLAEATTEGRKSSEESRSQGLKLLQESLEFSQRCLNVQEYQLNQSQERESSEHQDEQQEQQQQPVTETSESSATNTPTSASYHGEEETWATILEPVTPSSLLDTTIAQTETLTAICHLESSSASSGWPLAWVEEYYQSSLQSKLSTFATTTDRLDEARLAEAKFRCALADAAFRSSRIDLPTYLREVQESFQGSDMSSDPQELCDRADAELAFSASIRQGPLPDSENMAEMNEFSKTCWKRITAALDSLTTATKLPGTQNLARIHLRRGDCELLRLSLGETPTKYDMAIKSATVLLGNAGLYYRMAGRQAISEGAEAKEEGKEAYVKELIVSMLGDWNNEKEASFRKSSSDLTQNDVAEMVAEMQEEGLLGDEGVGKVLGLVS